MKKAKGEFWMYIPILLLVFGVLMAIGAVAVGVTGSFEQKAQAQSELFGVLQLMEQLHMYGPVSAQAISIDGAKGVVLLQGYPITENTMVVGMVSGGRVHIDSVVKSTAVQNTQSTLDIEYNDR